MWQDHFGMRNNNDVVHWSHNERKMWVIFLFLVTTILYAARVAMSVCASALAKEFGWNKADLGVVMGSFFWGYLTTQLLGGYIADKIGGDKLLCFSGIVWGLLTVFTPYVAHLFLSHPKHALLVLTLLRVLLGVSQGVHYPSMMSLMSHKIPKNERSLPNGIITSAANFGTVVCGGLGSFVLEAQGWQDVFYLIGGIGLIFTYLLKIFSQRPRVSERREHFPLGKKNDSSKLDSVPWKKILSKSPVWCLIFAHICANNCFYILLSWLPTYFHEKFPNEKGWFYNTVPWIMSVPASIFSGWVCDKVIHAGWSIGHTRKLMQGIAMYGSACFGLLFPFCSNFYAAVLCAGMAVSMHTFHNSGVLVNAQDIAPSCAGSVFGISNTFACIPGFVGVYLTGFILHVSGSWFAVFLYMALVNVVGGFAFIIGGSGERVV